MEEAYRYYEILGLTPDATPHEITQAYEILEKTYHPKVSSHPKAQENFEKVREAYAVLSDAHTKAEYDACCYNHNQHPHPVEEEGVRFPDDSSSVPHSHHIKEQIPKCHPDTSTYSTVIQKIIINIFIFLIVATAVFYGVAVMKASPNDNISPGYLAPALSGDTLPSQKDTWARQIKNAMDSEKPTTRDYALSLIDKSHAGERNVAQICDIWEKTYRKWTYVSDPKGFEYFSPASNTINIGLKGDCDDFAILIASLVESTSGSARVILAQGADEGGHAYAEVYVTDNEQDFDSIAQYITKRYNCRSVAYHVEYDDDAIPSYWLNLDWQSGRPGGEFYDSNGILTAYYSSGHWHKSVSGS